MLSINTCDKCKEYDACKEFNCTFYKIKVPSLEVAKSCKEFKAKRRVRKRCNKCIYQVYRPKNGNERQLYLCERKHIRMTYTALNHCKVFKKK